MSGRGKSALFVLAGVALGLFLSGFDSGADARSQSGDSGASLNFSTSPVPVSVPASSNVVGFADDPYFASDPTSGSSTGAESVPLRDSLEAGAAPRVSFVGNAAATFSRPLEVPPLYAFDAPLDGGGRQIILVDSETKRICVYWIRERGANSTIELVAARSFESDVKLDNFNGEGLTPAQIREQASALGER